ncbi:MAG: hypothetical protein M0Q91_10805 [Methanoregula sp.]|nr:hypothetical protein [Methanoregula sp.]
MAAPSTTVNSPITTEIQRLPEPQQEPPEQVCHFFTRVQEYYSWIPSSRLRSLSL